MSKPDWKDAPPWAQYLAQDRNGQWTWFDGPLYTADGAWYTEGAKAVSAIVAGWEQTLETRPVTSAPAAQAKPAPLLTREQFRLIIDVGLLAKTMQEYSSASDRFKKAGKRLDEIERLLCGD